MKAIYVLLLVSLVIESFADDRCTLYRAITNYGIDYNEKEQFMCLYSELATSPRPQDHFGHFAISRGWCYDPRRPGPNRCKINCADLGDPTFRNDIRCAFVILYTEGISAWGGVAPKCLGSNLVQYIPQCV